MPTKIDVTDPQLVELLTKHPIAYITAQPTEDPNKLQLRLSAENYVLETFELFPSKNVAGIQLLFVEKGTGLLIPFQVLEFIVDKVRETETLN